MDEPTAQIPALVDSHAHLDDAKLAADEQGVIARARAAGVACVVSVGADMASSRAAIEIASRQSMVYASVGVHPHDASEVVESDWEVLERLGRRDKVVAIGESGLDYFRDLSPRAVQRQVFARHLALARAAALPIIIHCREAYGDCLDILAAEWPPPVCGVLHCFQGSAAVARRALDLGLTIGFGGSITFPREDALRRVAASLPLERLLIETDAPYLTPRPKRGKNEPAYVRFVAERLAALRGVPYENVAEITTANARSLFALPARSGDA